MAFDTGPGNMVIDAVMQQLFGKSYDRDGKIAASGNARADVIKKLMTAPFFRQRPPRTAGREEFGREYAARFLQLCRGASKADIVATATALTARSIADAIRRFVLADKSVRAIPRDVSKDKRCRELIVSGGGAKNRTLITMLRGELAPLGVALRFSDDLESPLRPKRPWPLPCSRMKPGIAVHLIFRRRPEPDVQRFWGRFRMHEASFPPVARLTPGAKPLSEKNSVIAALEALRHPKSTAGRRRINDQVSPQSATLKFLASLGMTNLRGNLTGCVMFVWAGRAGLSSLLLATCRSRHANDDHREQPDQSRSARGR